MITIIDYAKSAELNNMGIDEMIEYFIRYPKSHKRVVSICDDCGMVRESDFVRARALCVSCAGTKRFSSAESREDVSTRQKAYWTPENRAKQSLLKTEFHKEHPEAGSEHSERMKEYIRTYPEHVDNLFKARADYYADPLRCAENSRQWYKYYEEHPEVRVKISETLKSSDAMKAIADKQRGGQDIVKHHFIYDHAHPDNHTVELTRAEHTAHHHWMRRAGLEVPHINSELSDVFGAVGMMLSGSDEGVIAGNRFCKEYRETSAEALADAKEMFVRME